MKKRLFGTQGIVPVPAFEVDEANVFFDMEVKEVPEKKYVLTQEELLSLLEDRALLHMLEWDGVDNWWGYGASREDFIATALGVTEKDVKNKDLTMRDVAIKNLECYE